MLLSAHILERRNVTGIHSHGGRMADSAGARAGLGSGLSRGLQNFRWILFPDEFDQCARDKGTPGSKYIDVSE